MQLCCKKGSGWLLFLQACNALQGSCFWRGKKRTDRTLRVQTGISAFQAKSEKPDWLKVPTGVKTIWYIMFFLLEDSGNQFFFLLKHEYMEILFSKCIFQQEISTCNSKWRRFQNISPFFLVINIKSFCTGKHKVEIKHSSWKLKDRRPDVWVQNQC